MTLNKIEISGFDYIMDNVFSPVVSECNSEIEQLLRGNSDINSKVEEKLERIMKNRAIKKALNAKLIIEKEKSKEFSGGKFTMNAKTGNLDELEVNLESDFTFVESKYPENIIKYKWYAYNGHASKISREPLQRLQNYDMKNTNTNIDFALAN